MKRFFLILLAIAAISNTVKGAERVYVSTDRNAYLAGERVWCSLFCLDEYGDLSTDSAVAYLELISENGSALQTKIGLLQGRGCGEFILPANLQEGNYLLTAYTATQSADSAIHGSRPISIYNTFVQNRLPSVTISDSVPTAIPEDSSLGITLYTPAFVARDGEFTLNILADCADISVSVYHEDPLSQLPQSRIEDFFRVFPISGEEDFSPAETSGETIHAVSTGADSGMAAVLSCAGGVENTYISSTREDGHVIFQTGNIYGDREMVCEIPEGGDNVRLEILSPFRHPKPGTIPSMSIGKDMFASLARRKASMSQQVKSDTLVRFLPKREDLFASGVSWEVFNLDDYNRFPTVSEVITEILPGLKLRRFKGKPVFEIMVANQGDSRRVQKDHVLAMMDGVVISSIDLILSFDAMLLSEVHICRQPVIFGNMLYNGVVNFVTKNNYVTALHFAPRVKVMDFSGVRYPVAYLGAKPKESAQDMRELLYWNPAMTVVERSSVRLNAPSYEGVFHVVAEGIGKDGKPVRAVTSFEVR